MPAASTPTGKTCLDVGASTGGFTQVLMERGAREDLCRRCRPRPVARAAQGQRPRGQHWKASMRADLTPSMIPEPIDLLVSDVSFVSVTQGARRAAGALRARRRRGHPVQAAVRGGPRQCRQGRHRHRPGRHRRRGDAVIAFMAAAGWAHRFAIGSPIAGGDGNREIVAGLRACLGGAVAEHLGHEVRARTGLQPESDGRGSRRWMTRNAMPRISARRSPAYATKCRPAILRRRSSRRLSGRR